MSASEERGLKLSDLSVSLAHFAILFPEVSESPGT
jgi:hypothetical protein